jgi:hypothetical protein
MAWVWVVLSLFVLWTLGISLMRHETTPRVSCGGCENPAARYLRVAVQGPMSYSGRASASL